MPRKTKTSPEEIAKAEKARDDRKRSRSAGFAKMKERDKSWQKLKNIYGGEVIIEWPVNRELDDFEIRRQIPEGMFVLTINGQTAMLDVDEFQKWLRWA